MLSLETVSCLKTVLRHILDVSVSVLVLTSLSWASVKTVEFTLYFSYPTVNPLTRAVIPGDTFFTVITARVNGGQKRYPWLRPVSLGSKNVTRDYGPWLRGSQTPPVITVRVHEHQKTLPVMFVSGNIRHDIISAKLHDTGANVSDHIDIDRVAYTARILHTCVDTTYSL